jgi:hypothetical protein
MEDSSSICVGIEQSGSAAILDKHLKMEQLATDRCAVWLRRTAPARVSKPQGKMGMIEQLQHWGSCIVIPRQYSVRRKGFGRGARCARPEPAKPGEGLASLLNCYRASLTAPHQA